MSTWRIGEVRPKNFLDLIFEDEEEALTMGGEEVVYDISDECDDEDFLKSEVQESDQRERSQSPLGLIDVRNQAQEIYRRERSRSPLGFIHDADIQPWRGSDEPYLPVELVAIYDAEGHRFDEEESFEDPDAHALFLPIEAMNENDVINARGRSRIDKGRGRVSGRGRGRRGRVMGREDGNLRRRPCRRWAVGDPLTEVWIDDDDVPEVLKCMVREVVRGRQNRAREREARVLRQRERDAERMAESGSEDDVYEDALLGPPESQSFYWENMATFKSEPEQFRVEQTGATSSVTTPLDAFSCFWDESILNHIVLETNRYAQTISSPAFQAEWCPTNIHEILCLFAFWMMLGVIRMPTIKSCFSRDPLLKTDIFRSIFTYHRYSNLSRALQCFDTTVETQDRLAYLWPIIEHLNMKFQTSYTPRQQICIDESLTLWKGKLLFKQYIRSKAAKFGIKTFELCESATGYLWSFIVYTGKDRSQDAFRDSTLLKSTKVVVDLIRPLLNKGYQLFMDNWFNSPVLARFLKRNGTDCIGTLRPSRRDVPPLVNLAKLQQGQFVARHAGDICVMAWQDKKKIVTLSTCHGTDTGMSTVPSRPTPRPIPMKPQVVLDYNRNMGGVDLKDQMLEPYLIERKRCAKWYMKLFKRLLNVSILNSRIILQSSMQTHQDHLAFRLRLVDDILQSHLNLCPKPRINPAGSSRPVPHQGHWPTRHEQRQSDANQNRKTVQKCALCLKAGRKFSKTPYKCESCDVSLCIEGCFKFYHVNK